MFESEEELQKLVHERPELILSGIPEIDPQYCPDTPFIVSLGREVPLNSGPIDNLYVDTNAIVTFVECKRYGDSRIKRDVYAQAINYAADLRSMLIHYSGQGFLDEFYRVISRSQDAPYKSFDELMEKLSQDTILEGKNVDDWAEQFRARLENNIKNGVFRILIVCGPTPDNAFSYSTVRNLMQLMDFSESHENKYDLILMDLRADGEGYVSKMIWRNFSVLPQIPLFAKATRDNSAGIESMRNRYANMPTNLREQLEDLLRYLDNNGVYLVENTQGFSAYSQKVKKALYTRVSIEDKSWTVLRHQIRRAETLFSLIEDEELNSQISTMPYTLEAKTSPRFGTTYDITLRPNGDTPPSEIGDCIIGVLGAAHMG